MAFLSVAFAHMTSLKETCHPPGLSCWDTLLVWGTAVTKHRSPHSLNNRDVLILFWL